LARSLDSARVDAAKQARKIHNLFRFVSDSGGGSGSSSSGRRERAPDDPTLLKFAPLFHTYAAISTALNDTCMDSVRLEQDMAAKGGPAARELTKARSERQQHAAAGTTGRRAVVGATTPVSHGRLPSDDLGSGSSPAYSPDAPTVGQIQDLESLPLLEVRGLESYEASRKAGDYMQLASMVRDLAHSFSALHEVASRQQGDIDLVGQGIDAARLETATGEANLRQASRYKAMGLVLAGGVTGAAVGGPLGALVGLKTGLVSLGLGAGLVGVGGALLGAGAAKQLQRARFVPLQHDGEEHELQRIQQQGIGSGSASAAAASASPSASASASTASTRSPSAAPSPSASPASGRASAAAAGQAMRRGV
jgi:hypothetical protein